MTQKRMKYVGNYDESLYWERVNRNLGWLGNSEDEQIKRQEKIRDVVIGIAGCGGIGGGIAERLVRLGVRNLKLADPDTFDISNINRQLGATVDNVGKNKAEVVAEIVYNITRDVNIEVYPEGIHPDTVDEFFTGCDYVMDKIDIYAIKARYTLHEAFRRAKQCNMMLFTPVIGHRSFFFKTTKNSMPVEEIFELPKNSEFTDAQLKQLIERLVPEMPKYPNAEMLDNWFIKKKCCPIFAGCPPISQGILTERIAFEIMGLEDIYPTKKLPALPGYAYFDAMTWETKIVHGFEWKNKRKEETTYATFT